jgi:BirA family transcriptional regulator, biotin operon repressor / biotin---[acetyl-CoA-carboxylase] ligase
MDDRPAVPPLQEPLTPDRIRLGLATRRIGRTVVLLEGAASTNDVALASADDPQNDGMAVFADHQTSGRGRLGRRWQSPRGASVLCSILLIEPSGEAGTSLEPGVLTLAAGVATHDAVTSAVADVEPTIQWPNDIAVAGRKLAGILIESRPIQSGRAFVIGVGINCLQHRGHFRGALRKEATSLEAESRHPVSRLSVARQLLTELDRWLASPPDPHGLRQAWLDRAEPLGQHIELRQGGHDYAGTTVDVDPMAGLVVELDGGGRRVFDPATTSLIRNADESQSKT